jgi:type I restriction enzyme, S subunit
LKDRNEKRPGYKQTKLGWIPEDWSYDFVRSTGSVLTGTTPSTLHPEYYGGKHPFVTPVDMGFSPWIKNSVSALTDDGLKKARKVCKGAVLFVCIGSTIGKVGIANVELATNQQINTIIPNNNNIGPYLYYALMYQSRRIASYAGCQAVPIINKSQFESVRVPLPPLPEQKKIAEILSTWDEAIEQIRKLIDAKRRCKKALMQQLLTGKKRLPEFNELWKEYRLGDLFEERREVNSEHLPLLAITGNRGVIPASEIERKDSSSADKSKYKRIAPGDIGYNTMRMWQGVSAVSGLEGIVSPAYTICIPKENVDVRFMGYFFKFSTVINLFRRFSQGLVNDTLNLKFNNFTQIKIKIPCADEQQAISKVLRIADDEIKTL